VGFEADKRSIRLSATFAGSRPDLLREAMTNMGAGLLSRVPNFYGKGGTSIAPFKAAMIMFFTPSFST
jgi:hypothetical protein